MGRVTGFPWWPAVVGRCPASGAARAGIRTWVFFFNHDTGAWLSLRDLRGMREWTPEAAAKIARKDRRAGEYLPGIQRAAELAIEFLATRGRVRPLEEYSATLTSAAFEPVALTDPSSPTSPAQAQGQKRARSPGSADDQIKTGSKVARKADPGSSSVAHERPAGSIPLKIRLSQSRRASYMKSSPSPAIASGQARPAGADPMGRMHLSVAKSIPAAAAKVDTGGKMHLHERPVDEGIEEGGHPPAAGAGPAEQKIPLISNSQTLKAEVTPGDKVTLPATVRPAGPGRDDRMPIKPATSSSGAASSVERARVVEETVIDGCDVPDSKMELAPGGPMSMRLDVKAHLAVPVSPSGSPTPLPAASRYNLASPLASYLPLASPDPSPMPALASLSIPGVSLRAAAASPRAPSQPQSGQLPGILSPRAGSSRRRLSPPPKSLGPPLPVFRPVPVKVTVPDVVPAPVSLPATASTPASVSLRPQAPPFIPKTSSVPIRSTYAKSVPSNTPVASLTSRMPNVQLPVTQNPPAASAAGRPNASAAETPQGRPVTAAAAVNHLLGRPADREQSVGMTQARMDPLAGEDETAASLRATVELVVRASEEFARGHAYNRAAIGQAVDRLFPDPAPGTPGQRSCRMARDAARALVMNCLP